METQDRAVLETITAACGAARALLFLSVPWSCPERNARQVFRAAVARLEEFHPGLEVRFFQLDEDAEACQEWLSSLNVPQLGGGYPRGAGSLLWLEKGKVVAYEISANSLGDQGIVASSVALWHDPH
jgi:hypothetical protein